MSADRWQGKVVLVTGGSSGLGKSLAEAFALRGARVVIAARGVELLQTVSQHLTALGHDVLGLPADVTQQPQVELLFDEIKSRYGQLDVLANCAGRSARRTALDTSPEEFKQLLDVNFLAVVRCVRAAAPLLLAAKGHVVNVSSLAGKSAARYVGAYPASKAALNAYTHQLRLELGDEGLHVLLVCPGPIARDKVRTYGAEELTNLPESARKPGAGVKTKPIAPDWLAEKIVAACESRRLELVVPAKARILFALQELFPSWGDRIVKGQT